MNTIPNIEIELLGRCGGGVRMMLLGGEQTFLMVIL
jgi:hypothetical protein